MKKTMMIMLAFVLLFSMASTSLAKNDKHKDHSKHKIHQKLEFKDQAKASWAIPFIQRMRAKNVLSGYEDGSFRPNQPVNRAEVMVTAVKLMDMQDEVDAMDEDETLLFNDAKQIEKHAPWAKNYILVGLEQGLLDTNELNFQPKKPAARVWVAMVLVKALGYEEEALQQMNELPNFSDADDIPAGAVGYVNVAVEKGIVSGYPNGTFAPNKPVSRAEMAVLLDKTDDELKDENGTLEVNAVIQAVDFSDDAVSEDVYGNADGHLVVRTFNGDDMKVYIDSALEVQFRDTTILADQLNAGDIVYLAIDEGVVSEAVLLGSDDIIEDLAEVQELKIVLKRDDDDQYFLNYKNKRGTLEAEITREVDGEESSVEGEDAIELIETLLDEMGLDPSTTRREAAELVMEALNIEADEFEELALYVQFANGQTIRFGIEQDGGKHDDDDDDDENEHDEDENNEDEQDGEEAGEDTVQKLEVEAKLGRMGELEVVYSYKDGKADAKIEYKVRGHKMEVKGDAAIQWLEKTIPDFPEIDPWELKQTIEGALDQFDMDPDDIKKWEIKIETKNGFEYEL